jgi:hypothetical protein
MKNISLSILFLICIANAISAQKKQQIVTTDMLSVNQVFEKEAIFFYEKNWKAFRDQALKQKFISGYQLIMSAPDSTGSIQIVLLTMYPDSVSFANSEKNFRPIMKKISPNGPHLLNEINIREKFQYVGGTEGKTLFYKQAY